ncbi:glycosidase [Vibrio variabilis]|uniref:Glycosidase n=1 Tax=Vibrio variabilis TaxID=990271 RepID=A0ABQ0JJ63_9VIBR|nr:glycosidase [Vibrio variabilis]
MSGAIEGVTGDNILTPNQTDLKDYVKELMTLRSQHSSLSQGERTNVVATTSAYADLKTTSDESVLYVVNTTDSNQTIAVPESSISFSGELKDLQSNETVALTSGHFNIDLTPFEARFLLLSQ